MTAADTSLDKLEREVIAIKTSIVLGILLAGGLFMAARLQAFEEDVFMTSKGDLKITFIGHGTLMFAWNGKIIHIDPVRRYADYTTLPKADIVLVTHEHGDHLDPKAIEAINKPSTLILAAETCKAALPSAVVMKNGDSRDVQGIKIEAVPAYNNSPGVTFHPKGRGNGYVLNLDDKRIFVAGDTENIPEMASLKGIDIAFLPTNLPYTMSVEIAAAAARIIRPQILYPYHFGNSDTTKLVELLKDTPGIEVRIRKLS